MNNIAKRLLKLRKEKGLSQEEVGNIIGVSRQTISKWETGESIPDFDKIIPLCDLYNITTDELIRGDTTSKDDVNSQTVSLKEGKAYNPYKKVKKYEALVVSISVFLYVLSIAWVVLMESLDVISEEMIASIFLLILAMPSCLLTFYYISLHNQKKYLNIAIKEPKDIEKYPKLNKYKDLDNILGLGFLIIYLYISFITGSWYITWLLWLIYPLVIKIIHLVLDMKKEGR